MSRTGPSRTVGPVEPGHVHVWTACLGGEAWDDEALGRILDDRERSRAMAFRLERDRRRFVRSHGMLRHLLAACLGVPAAEIVFAEGPHGKPRLAAPRRADLHFSLSHSGACCAVALRPDHPVGIDVELLRELPQATAIAHRMFAPHEAERLERLDAALRRRAFFALWCRKEACSKALGGPLADHLDRFEFAIDDNGAVRLIACDDTPLAAGEWAIQGFEPMPGHVGALATRAPIRSLAQRKWPVGQPPCPSG